MKHAYETLARAVAGGEKEKEAEAAAAEEEQEEEEEGAGEEGQHSEEGGKEEVKREEEEGGDVARLEEEEEEAGKEEEAKEKEGGGGGVAALHQRELDQVQPQFLVYLCDPRVPLVYGPRTVLCTGLRPVHGPQILVYGASDSRVLGCAELLVHCSGPRVSCIRP